MHARNLFEKSLEWLPFRSRWMIVLHVTFLFSGVMFAAMDWIASLTEKNEHAIRMYPAPKD